MIVGSRRSILTHQVSQPRVKTSRALRDDIFGPGRIGCAVARRPQISAFVAPPATPVVERHSNDRGVILLDKPRGGPVRRGDLRSIPKHDLLKGPTGIGRAALDWIGGQARAGGLYWPTGADLAAREALIAQVIIDVHHDVVSPNYYRKEFHGYGGNGSRDSAAHQATAMAAVPAIMTGQPLEDAFAQRLAKLKGAVHCYQRHQGVEAARGTRLVVDLGCGTGSSTRVLAREYANAQVVGVDLSPTMLQEAKAISERTPGVFSEEALQQLLLGDAHPEELVPRLHWLHDNIEGTRLAPGSADLVTIHFVCHELPIISQNVLYHISQEALRLLRPGGWFGVIDNDQNAFNLHKGSAWMRPIPGAVEGLRRVAGAMAREPHLHEYVAADLPASLRQAGMVNVEAVDDVPGCTMVVGQKPV